MKKVLSVLLAVCLLVGALPMTASAQVLTGKAGENVTYRYDTSTGELSFSGTGPMKDFEILEKTGGPDDFGTIIEHYVGTPIDWTSVRSVKIGSGITRIGDNAFSGCDQLRSVSIAGTVTSIGISAFDWCTSLTKIDLPNGISEIPESTFSGCSKLASITLPSKLKTIGEAAFYCCGALKSLYFGSDVEDIDFSAFWGCESLSSISVADNNKTFKSIDGVLLSKDGSELMLYPRKKPSTTYSVPSGVKEIWDEAFANCTSLSTLTIPEGVQYVGYQAFKNCSSLTSVSVPSTVEYEDSYLESAFRDNPKLKTIKVAADNPYYKDVDGILFSKDGTNLYVYPAAKTAESYTVPEGVTAIGGSAFGACPFLKSVRIPSSVTEMIYDTIFAGYYVTPFTDVIFADRDRKVTIYGTPGSEAEKVAKYHGFPFVTWRSTPTVAGFNDVYEDDYYADAVKWAVESGITAGTDKTHFSPNASCTRAQAVTFLWRAAGEPEPQNTPTKFNDVKAGSYYEKAVQWAVENGVTAGTGETTFSPNATCTRAQIVTFLYRAENSPEITGNNSFNDVKTGAYYENAVKWAVENNITSGTGGNKFSPDNNCIRGQIVTFLYRYSK